VDLSKVKAKKEVISIPYREINGVKTIPVKLNGVSMDMIYDTGCSGVHMSLLELQTLYKNGKFSQSDVIGTSMSQIADGSVVQNGVIILREIEIGGEDGIVLPNVEASVSLNQEAPILLGNGALDKVAAVEVDNVKKTINFKRY
jgi:predicted aspartyl protease